MRHPTTPLQALDNIMLAALAILVTVLLAYAI